MRSFFDWSSRDCWVSWDLRSLFSASDTGFRFVLKIRIIFLQLCYRAMKVSDDLSLLCNYLVFCVDFAERFGSRERVYWLLWDKSTVVDTAQPGWRGLNSSSSQGNKPGKVNWKTGMRQGVSATRRFSLVDSRSCPIIPMIVSLVISICSGFNYGSSIKFTSPVLTIE